MRLLLDTHLLLWSVASPDRLSRKAHGLLGDEGNQLLFSVASLWEIAIKASHNRSDFIVDVRELRDELLQNGYLEVTVLASHAMAIVNLPHVHKDPFDRLLLAQAICENLTLLTVDEKLATYPGPVVKV